jgi:alkanesulfonate monooxygenase SsuD/methylene tetrahydromethanopterin reductase-like flavin-dependent oxidoreductase (luciferase family)
VRYAINTPNFGAFADPRVVIRMARAAEDAGWDGYFLWDHLQGGLPPSVPFADPWIELAAIAATTDRIALGPLVAAPPRRRPWKLARETVTLDHLSGGRLILGVGLGFPPDAEYEVFGEDPSLRTRAEKLDESLELLVRFWRGEPVRYEGTHYRVGDITFLPRPLQEPRIPVWVAATVPLGGPLRGPLQRAAHWDGVAPLRVTEHGIEPLRPEDISAVMAIVAEERAAEAIEPSTPFDVVAAGMTGDDRAADLDRLAALAEAGTTWWSEDLHEERASLPHLLERVRRGPPRP